MPLENLVSKNGTLNLKTGFSGSLDAMGWRMALDGRGAPRFVRDNDSKPLRSQPEQPSLAEDANWDDRFGGPGATGIVVAIAVSGTDVYVGGQFNLVNNVLVNGIAKWNGSGWSALSGGVDGFIGAIAVSGSDVYAGGTFTSAGGVSANNIAKWNGSSWSALGSGVNAHVEAIVASGSDVYVGGRFSTAGGIPAGAVAKWNGSGWSTLGSGLSGGFVLTIAINGSDVYVGGNFTAAGGQPANFIARWNGSSWSDVGGGVNSNVNSIVVSGTNVYVGGFFSAAGGVPASYMAKWNGSSWSALGSGFDNDVKAIAVVGSDVYAAGEFTTAGGVSAARIAKWNGSTWSALGSGVDGRFVAALGGSGADLYVAGDFSGAGGLIAHSIAKWSNGWTTVGSDPGLGLNNEVRAVAVSGNDAYAGGRFTAAGGVSANRIAKWDGSSWSALGTGVDDTIQALVANGTGVYAGGDFNTAGGVSANHIAKWNGSGWLALGSGMNGSVDALAVNGSDVYVGGAFTTAGGISAIRIAKWNGSTWSNLGSGMNGNVLAIAISGSDVYVGGDFTVAGGVSANHIAKWNGSTWSALGLGVDGSVLGLAVNGSDVYVGGFFGTAGGVPSNRIAKWNGNSWSSLGRDMTASFIAAVAISGNDVYVGGSIDSVGQTRTGGIARWDGSNWSTLGSGTNFEVAGIASNGNSVYVGGAFRSAGQKASFFFGRWTSCTFSIMPSNQSFSAGGGSSSVAVTTTAGCSWNATSNDNWIHITGGSSGTGNGAVAYSVDANTGPARSGTMTIAGQTFTVNQDSGCAFSINPTSQNFSAAGGTASVSVTTANGCGWNATSNDSFITINSGSSGSGSGTVSYTVAASVVPARSGTMTIGGQTFTVNQANGVVWTISGRITDGTNGLGSIAVGLSGSATLSTTTNSSGNYSFPSLPSGGTYTVMPSSATYNFNPQLQTFADLSGNRTADFVGTLKAQPTPIPTPTIEDFRDPARNPQVWNLGSVTEPASFDPAVAVIQENGRLKITPRENATAPAFNGYNSVRSFDLTDGSAGVEVVQPGSGGTETLFGLSGDHGNTYFRFNAMTAGAALRAGLLDRKALKNISPNATTESMVLMLQIKIDGIAQPSVPLSYDPRLDRFWRIRHSSGKGGIRKSAPQQNSESTTDACPPGTANGSLVFETSVDSMDWNPRKSIELCVQLKALQIELNAGTHVLQPHPGAVLFDNLDVKPNPQVEFASANYDVNEGAGTATITVVRSVDTTIAVDVDAFTVDNDQYPCSAVTGKAKQNCDYVSAATRLHFDAGQTQKTFTVSIIDDAYVEGNETLELKLSNNSEVSVGNIGTVVLRIVDNDASPRLGNPIDDTPLFVRQQYLDFLNREPDAGGFGYWTFRFADCGQNARCIQDTRIEVADAFFFEPEFQQTGAYVYRVYTAAFGGRPTYNQFTADIGHVSVRDLEPSKTAYALTFVQRDDYLMRYPRTQTASQYVDALLETVRQSSGVDLSPQRAVLIGLADGTDNGRAAILKRVADSPAFIDGKYNSSFVLMEYFGYLRRDPEQSGFDFWLSKVNEKPLRDVGIQHTMACAFITSDEYQQRFNSDVTRRNADCKRD